MTAPPPPIAVRAQSGATITVVVDNALTEAAAYLAGLLRDRRQWRNVESARDSISDYCVDYLKPPRTLGGG
jgi:hypothetical protein